MKKALQRTREKETNLVESDKEQTTAAKCEIYINRKPIKAIVDSGVATSIITKPLL